jgi:DNA-binding NtrC family response regulator
MARDKEASFREHGSPAGNPAGNPVGNPAGSLTGSPVGNPHAPTPDPRPMVYADPASKSLVKLLARIAPSDMSVMISGDSGTGKEVVARHIHKVSGRTGAFVVVNCSAIAEQLTTSEDSSLNKPSGTTGTVRSDRWFEDARHGTLFLDEIADLPATLQNRLLRTLQEHEATHAGSPAPGPNDVRLVAATKVDLSETVSAGHFRLELFYRLNVGQIKLLPLRQRRIDVAALAHHFLGLYGKRLNLPPPLLGEDAVATLTQYPWPGNVRELENVIHFALLVAPEQELRSEHLKLGGIQAVPQTAAPTEWVESDELPGALSKLLIRMFHEPSGRLLNDLESQIIAEAFKFAGENQVRTAALLGISRNVVRTLLRKHGLFIGRRRKPRGGPRSLRAPAMSGSTRPR